MQGIVSPVVCANGVVVAVVVVVVVVIAVVIIITRRGNTGVDARGVLRVCACRCVLCTVSGGVVGSRTWTGLGNFVRVLGCCFE